MAIQQRRGAYANFDPTKMLPGEPAVVQSGDPNTTDGKSAYVAFSAGDVKRLVFSDDLENAVEEVAEDLVNTMEAAINTFTNTTVPNAVSTINSTGANQVSAVQAKGTEVLESIPEDYTELSEDVGDLKDEIVNKTDKDKAYFDLTSGSSGQLLTDSGTVDKMPYQFRRTGGGVTVGTRAREQKIVGGTVAWNQMIKPIDSTNWRAEANVTASFDNGKAVFTSANKNNGVQVATTGFIASHVYFYSFDAVANSAMNLTALLGNSHGVAVQNAITQTKSRFERVTRANSDTSGQLFYLYPRFDDSVNIQATVENVNVIDITQLLGSTIADYIHSLEQTTTGEGAKYFRSMFPKPYYPYDAGSLKSVEVSAKKTTGFNQFNKETAQSNSKISAQGEIESGSYFVSDFIRVIPDSVYYIKDIETLAHTRSLVFYDADKSFVSVETVSGSVTHISFEKAIPSNVFFIRIAVNPEYLNSACVSISDPQKNGTYEPYDGHTYPLTPSTLRGIFKLNGSEIYADGDEYPASGKKKVRYGIVDLGTLYWNYAGGSWSAFYASLGSSRKPGLSNVICGKYGFGRQVSGVDLDHICGGNEVNSYFYIRDSSYSGDAAAFKSAMSGVYLVYELVTPTAETADPYTEYQVISQYGTEEFVCNTVTPVGHDTLYMDDLAKKIDGLPWDLSMIAPIDNGTTATRAYSTGQYFLHNDQFCKAKTNIASGATFTLNTNYEVTTVAAELYAALH